MPKRTFGPPTLKQHNQREYYRKNRAAILAKQKAYVQERRAETSAYQLQWAREHKEKVNAANKRVRDKYRKMILDHYGRECECCQESREEFLELDHVNGGGNKHREEVGGSTQMLYKWVIDQGYPNEFRILCSNCNKARGNFGYCPHEVERVAYA